MIELRGIKKKYDRRHVLNGVDAEFSPGTIVGIVGANGSGKTTLLTIIAGVGRSDSGEVVLYGKSVRSAKEISRLCSYIPQENPLYEDMSVRDNLGLLMGEKASAERVGAVSRRFGLDEYLKEKVKNLSGGTKRRVAVAAALAEDRPILLLDEPTAALDIPSKDIIWGWLESHKQKGGSIILTTHEREEMDKCDRLLVMEDGFLKEKRDVQAQACVCGKAF